MADAVAAVRIVLEFDEGDLPTGVARRYRHLLAALGTLGTEPATDVVNAAPRRTMSAGRRLAAARRFASHWTHGTAVPVIVVGLGTPTMLVLASMLAGRGRVVLFDASDSTGIQLRDRLGAGGTRLVAVAVAMLALHLGAPRALAMVYVADRDRRADRWLNRRRRAIVVPASAPPALRLLPGVRTPLQRVVVPADLSSFHVHAGFRMLVEAMRLRRPAIPVEVFGPVTPTGEGLAVGLVYRGWEPDLADVYAGDTAVLVLNVGGSGVPNKVVEALAARRPLVLHRTVALRLGLEGSATLFETPAELAGALERVRVSPAAADAGPDDAAAAGGIALRGVIGVPDRRRVP